MTENQVVKSAIRSNFRDVFMTLKRPQKAFLYESTNGIQREVNGVRGIYYDVYFSPDCKRCMPHLIIELGAVECETPIRDELTPMCIAQEFEDLVWGETRGF